MLTFVGCTVFKEGAEPFSNWSLASYQVERIEIRDLNFGILETKVDIKKKNHIHVPQVVGDLWQVSPFLRLVIYELLQSAGVLLATAFVLPFPLKQQRCGSIAEQLDESVLCHRFHVHSTSCHFGDRNRQSRYRPLRLVWPTQKKNEKENWRVWLISRGKWWKRQPFIDDINHFFSYDGESFLFPVLQWALVTIDGRSGAVVAGRFARWNEIATSPSAYYQIQNIRFFQHHHRLFGGKLMKASERGRKKSVNEQ